MQEVEIESIREKLASAADQYAQPSVRVYRGLLERRLGLGLTILLPRALPLLCTLLFSA